MLSTILILHVIVCILLVIVVLVQFGKGAEAGAMMGGGSSQQIFTSSSKGNFFTKMTTFLAIAFMATSITLTTLKSKKAKESVFDDEAPVATPLNSDGDIQPSTPPAAETKTENTNSTETAPEATKPAAENTNSTEAKTDEPAGIIEDNPGQPEAAPADPNREN